jgi:hypothetical protein
MSGLDGVAVLILLLRVIILILLCPQPTAFNENPSTPIAIGIKKNEHFGKEKQTYLWISHLNSGNFLLIAGTPQLDPVCPASL